MATDLLGSLRVLRHRPVATLWVAQLLSAFGDKVYEIAVVWLAVDIIGGEAGFVLAAGAVASLVFGVLGGVYADRCDRQKTMIWVDVLRALSIFTLPIGALVADITLLHLALVAAVVGGLSALFSPSLQASLPALTPDSRALQKTNALLDVTARAARIFGPGLAGLLVAVLPLEHFFSIDAVTFLVSALALLSLWRSFAWKPKLQKEREQGVKGVLVDIGDAFTFVQGHRALFWCIIGSAVINVLWSAAFTVGAALLAREVLRADVGVYGLIVAAYGVGNVLSNLVVGGLDVKNRARFFFVGKLILGSGFLILAFAPTLWVALAGAALAALGGPMGDLMLLLMIQEDSPEDQIGKVYSLRTTLSSGGASLGLVLAGSIFTLLSVPLGIALCAAVMVGVGLAGTVRFRA